MDDFTPREIAQAHALDASEQARTSGVRAMAVASDLLATALDALDAGALDVAREHIARAMARMS